MKNYSQSDIAGLLSRFYAGGTSPDEEQMLWQLLERPGCSGRWQADRRLLRLLHEPPVAAMPERLPGRIAAALADAGQQSMRRDGWRRGLRWWLPYSAAAVLCGILFSLRQMHASEQTIYVDTCLNTAEAAHASEDALVYVAEQISGAMDEKSLGGPCD